MTCWKGKSRDLPSLYRINLNRIQSNYLSFQEVMMYHIGDEVIVLKSGIKGRIVCRSEGFVAHNRPNFYSVMPDNKQSLKDAIHVLKDEELALV